MGNKKLKEINSVLTPKKITCLCCGESFPSDSFYVSDSLQYRAYGKIPYCKECINKMYQGYLSEFKKLCYADPERKAVQRLCMALDLFYRNDIFDSAIKEWNKFKAKYQNDDLLFISYFMKHTKMYQYRKYDYNSTINNEFKDNKERLSDMSVFNTKDSKMQEKVSKAVKIFGAGFPDEDYLWLYDTYQDWTSRHECQTKAQEENFKAICFNRLNAYKANLHGDSTKDLDKTFNDLLNTGNLQPKQNKGETIADTQTFGTLIEKWEDTAPIPEVDEELKDVDKLGLFLDVFFRGHLAKFMGLKNGVSKYYDEYMKQFTITKPSKREGIDNEETMDDSEIIFDTLFGNSTSNKEE